MTWQELCNVAGLILQLGGVGGIIVWYRKRIRAVGPSAGQHEAGGASARLTVSTGQPTLEDRVAALTRDLGKLRREVDGSLQARDEATRDNQQDARRSEHEAAFWGVGSSAAIVLGLVFQLVAAFAS